LLACRSLLMAHSSISALDSTTHLLALAYYES
jgi:hypothetical protein